MLYNVRGISLGFLNSFSQTGVSLEVILLGMRLTIQFVQSTTGLFANIWHHFQMVLSKRTVMAYEKISDSQSSWKKNEKQ